MIIIAARPKMWTLAPRRRRRRQPDNTIITGILNAFIEQHAANIFIFDALMPAMIMAERRRHYAADGI